MGAALVAGVVVLDEEVVGVKAEALGLSPGTFAGLEEEFVMGRGGPLGGVDRLYCGTRPCDWDAAND